MRNSNEANMWCGWKSQASGVQETFFIFSNQLKCGSSCCAGLIIIIRPRLQCWGLKYVRELKKTFSLLWVPLRQCTVLKTSELTMLHLCLGNLTVECRDFHMCLAGASLPVTSPRSIPLSLHRHGATCTVFCRPDLHLACYRKHFLLPCWLLVSECLTGSIILKTSWSNEQIPGNGRYLLGENIWKNIFQRIN